MNIFTASSFYNFFSEGNQNSGQQLDVLLNARNMTLMSLSNEYCHLMIFEL